jgi:hypothetical protein
MGGFHPFKLPVKKGSKCVAPGFSEFGHNTTLPTIWRRKVSSRGGKQHTFQNKNLFVCFLRLQSLVTVFKEWMVRIDG